MSHQLDSAHAHVKQFISKIREIYGKKLISTYIPYSPPKDILPKLKDKKFEHCPHEVYTSSEAFANHILWTLHLTSVDHHDHYQHMQLLHLTFRQACSAGICNNCINVLLSIITFKDSINFYAIWSRECPLIIMKDDHLYSLCHLLFEYYCCHPKLPKIMVRTCELSKNIYLQGNKIKLQNKMKVKLNDRTFHGIGFFVHDFDYLCSLMTTLCESNLKEHPHENPEFTVVGNAWTRITQLRYFRMFYLCIKYWNIYHLIFFVNNHFDDLLKSFLVPCNKQMKQYGLLRQNIDLASIIVAEIIWKWQKLRAHCFDKNISNVLLPHKVKHGYKSLKLKRRECRSNIKEALVKQVKCSWLRCCKKQDEHNVKFQVCGGCKMVYYCSKHCQKKAWIEHRNHCGKLKQYNA
eukprot:281022_1